MPAINKNNKDPFFYQQYSAWLIPLLALLVIFQTVVLITTNTSIEESFSRLKPSVSENLPFVPTPKEEEKAVLSLASLSFVPSGLSLKQKETTNVDLVFTPKKDLYLDGIDIALSFNPQFLQISQINTPKLFSLLSQNKEKEKEGKLYLTFLEEKLTGLLFTKDKPVKLLTLVIKGNLKATTDITIIDVPEGPSTVITESNTSKKVEFEKQSLRIVIY